ncbi:MAG: YhdH/YhfP family quinone oxidoreductase [Bacteroidales bacterium]|nr:YhdH/YhfP family quinone oxidoreductase [Bacteroidales bacterium]
MKKFKAFVVEEIQENQFSGTVKEQHLSDLPPGDVLVQVKYSSLNYKDALSASGNRGVSKNYPHTPGIDAAGVVHESSDVRFKTGDEVIVTSYDLGMNTAGGFGQYIRVPANWVVPLPTGMALKESMILGTAGFTAAMAIFEILKEIPPDSGEILVTGASGGVGSMAVAILSKLGYQVVAVSGKESARNFLKTRGASRFLSREEALDKKERPLLKPQWTGVIDTVGGDMLANAIKAAMPGGVVAACGNAASPDLPINVFPFILRGVKLIGIDSQNCRMPHREYIWKKLAKEWKIENPESMSLEIGLSGLQAQIDRILSGKITGRILVKIS